MAVQRRNTKQRKLVLDAVRQQAGITFPADAGKQA